MKFAINYLNSKFFVFIFLIFNLNLNTYSQNVRKNNFFADIKSIDLAVQVDGDFNFCNVRESDIRTAVGYTLANSPLKKIDKDSLDYLYISAVVINTKSDRGTSLGCSAAIAIELKRPTTFRGSFNYVTLWSDLHLRLGSENSISRQINSAAEIATKDFIVKWAEQN